MNWGVRGVSLRDDRPLPRDDPRGQLFGGHWLQAESPDAAAENAK